MLCGLVGEELSFSTPLLLTERVGASDDAFALDKFLEP